MHFPRLHTIAFYRLLVLLICIFTLALDGFSQKSFGFRSAFVTGFQTKEVQVYHERMKFTMPVGAQLDLIRVRYLKNIPVQIHFGLGAKYVRMGGLTQGDLTFYTNTIRGNGFLGGRYVLNDKWELGGELQIENNRDFQETIYFKADLWRFYAQLEAAYKFHSKWEACLSYALSLNHNEPVYLMYLPANQLKIGVNYYFNER